MDIRTLTPRYSVSPQISVDDLAAIAQAGFTTVICNRPDSEVEPSQHIAVIAAAARDAGLDFHALPIGHQGMSAETISAQRDLIATSAGPVLAYCRTGTRCTFVWALGQAGTLGADEIITAAAAAGYDVEQLRPNLG